MKAQAVLSPFAPPRRSPVKAARRVLVVDDDPAILHLITKVLLAAPVPFQPLAVGSAEAALQLLAAEDGIDCLLADVVLPGMDGLQLLLSAHQLRPELKIVVMTSAPSDDLHHAVLENGARLLAKPLDAEDLLASLEIDRPGALSRLEGDLDLVDVCRLSAACQGDGGVRIRQGDAEGALAHRGTTLVHAAVDGLAGLAAFESLRSWRQWQFESLSGLRAATLEPNCELPMADGRFRDGARAAGSLRGLTLRHLIEWAMRYRQSCTLMVTSQRRSGILAFEAGSIRSAETGDREGARAAAEILGWESLRVELIRSPAATPLAAKPRKAPKDGSTSGLETLIDRFCEEVEGVIATSVVRRHDSAPVAIRSTVSHLDAAAAARLYARLVDSHLAAVEVLGAGDAWGETEDILITTAKVYLLIRRLGDEHYHWLAVSSQANLAFCRLLMRSHAAFLLSGLAELGELGGG
ncbi:MAG TPA: response regulator [Thermoanaerobaculia bacterium]|nr:response regulator [Thermoanaerobaculia bacterium]